MVNKRRIIEVIGSFSVLLICYFLSRHDVLGQWHYMKQWPVALCVLGAVVIILACIANYRKTVFFAPIGYGLGFVLAMVFNTDGLDPGGGTTNNGWIIWTVSFLVIVAIGAIWESVSEFIQRSDNHG